MKALTRRSLMLAAGMLACAAIPTARAAKKREWPALPEVPTDLNAERLFVELAENGEGVRFESRKGAPVVNMVFDPQCQWCVWEFEQFRPFMDRVTFVWHPVAVLNPWSELQGAAILAAKDPKATFMEHEKHFRDEAFKGLDVRKMTLPFEKREKVWDNSKIFRRAGGNSVPFGVLKTTDGRYVPIPQVTTADFARLSGLKA